MKKIWLIILAGFFGATLIGISMVGAVRGEEKVFDTDKEQIESKEADDEEASAGAKVEVKVETPKLVDTKVEYYLAYPGILPDHPVYWMKMIRDRVLLWLTRNPEEKVVRLMLYADKRINAAKVLAEGNQKELAIATATKAEKYLAQAVAEAVKLDAGKEETKRLMGKLQLAHLKHEEILQELAETVPTQAKAVVEQVMTETKNGWREVSKWLGEEGLEIEEKEATEGGKIEGEKELEKENKKVEGDVPVELQETL